MFSLYLDEDALDSSLLVALRAAGFDCLTTSEAGMRGRSDEEQLTFATSEGRVLFTRNGRDFRILETQWLAGGRNHAGIVVLSRRAAVGVRLRAFQAMAERFSAEDMKNRLEFLLNYAELR